MPAGSLKTLPGMHQRWLCHDNGHTTRLHGSGLSPDPPQPEPGPLLTGPVLTQPLSRAAPGASQPVSLFPICYLKKKTETQSLLKEVWEGGVWPLTSLDT